MTADRQNAGRRTPPRRLRRSAGPGSAARAALRLLALAVVALLLATGQLANRGWTTFGAGLILVAVLGSWLRHELLRS